MRDHSDEVAFQRWKDRCTGLGGGEGLEGLVCSIEPFMAGLLQDATTMRNELKPGEELAGYRVIEEVGRGGMGVVYRGESLGDCQPVAIKLLAPLRASSKQAENRFAREARIMGSLKHPRILRVHDFGHVGGVPYLVQELVPNGRALSHWINEQRGGERLEPGSLDWLLKFFADAAQALCYAHGRGVLHRDVKPSNLLVADDGTVRVADFGVARTEGMTTSITETDQIVGTLRYMSPEQARGAGTLDARSDQFALGASLYEALTLRRAFAGEAWVQLRAAIDGHVPPRPSVVRAGVPRAVDTVCSRLLEKDRRDRYCDLGEVAADLERVRVGRRPSRRRRAFSSLCRQAWQKRSVRVVTGLVAASVLGAFAWDRWQGDAAVVAAPMQERDARELKAMEQARLAHQGAMTRFESAQRFVDKAEEGLEGVVIDEEGRIDANGREMAEGLYLYMWDRPDTSGPVMDGFLSVHIGVLDNFGLHLTTEQWGEMRSRWDRRVASRFETREESWREFCSEMNMYLQWWREYMRTFILKSTIEMGADFSLPDEGVLRSAEDVEQGRR